MLRIGRSVIGVVWAFAERGYCQRLSGLVGWLFPAAAGRRFPSRQVRFTKGRTASPTTLTFVLKGRT